MIRLQNSIFVKERSMCPLLLFLPYTPKILKTLFSIAEFAFRRSNRDKICVLNNTAYWIKNNNKANGNSYSLNSVKQAGSYFLGNCFFKVAFQIFFRYLVFYRVQILTYSSPNCCYFFRNLNRKVKLKNLIIIVESEL